MTLYEEHATVGQRVLWLMHHYRGAQGQLNYPLLLRLRGPLDAAALRRALDTLVARHESLRTTFARRQGLLTQLIAEPAPVPFREVQAEPARLQELIYDEVTTPIDPRTSPVRVTLWRLGPAEHVLCINAHHIVTDAWSCRILTEELLLLLAGADKLPPLGWQYRHFAAWQRRKTTATRLKADRDYWQQQLRQAQAPALPRPGGPPAPSGPGDRHSVTLDLGSGHWKRLQQLARAEQTTPFTVLLSLCYLALHQETAQRDLALSSPFANRPRPEVMRTVGFFANMLVLRTCIEPGFTFTDLLRRTRTTVREAQAHQGFPYFLADAGQRGDRERHVEDIVFQMLPELPPPTTAGGLQAEVLPPVLASRFHLEFSALPHQDGLRILMQYAPEHIDAAGAQRLAGRFRSLARQIIMTTDFTIDT